MRRLLLHIATIVLGLLRRTCTAVCPQRNNSAFLRQIEYCSEPCESECTSLVPNEDDNCFLLERCPDPDKDNCICFPGNFDGDFEALPAKDKLRHVWDMVRSTPEPSRTWQEKNDVITSSVLKVFQTPRDYYPEGDVKALHSAYGAHSIVELRVDDNDAHEYRGLFRSGCKHAILRISGSVEFPGQFNVMSPGIGIKCFIDGTPSANLALMNDVIPRPNFDIWNRNYSNHYEPLIETPPPFFCPFLEKFLQASTCPAKLSSVEWAFDRGPDFDICDPVDSVADAPPVPFRLVFVPNPHLSFPSEPYCPTTFLQLMAGIDKHTKIFDVYGQTGPNTPANIKLFSVWTRSKFRASSFGDSRLSFRHVEFETDFVFATFGVVGWIGQINTTRDCQSPQVRLVPPLINNFQPLQNISCPLPGRTNCPAIPPPPPDDASATANDGALQCSGKKGKQDKKGSASKQDKKGKRMLY